jgi:xylose dehydrogenase (NAD/NADP)
MTTILCWGLLSTARINRSIIPALRLSPRSQLVGVASRSLEKARSYARQWDIPKSYGSYEALLNDPEIDVVYNPLPNYLHAHWTIQAALAGKHVLVEKPLALSVEELDAISAAARRTGVLVMEAFMYRHHSKTHKVVELVRSRAIGRLRQIRSTFTLMLNRPEDYRWRPECGGGSLWDVGCYLVDYSRLIAGSLPLEVCGYQVAAPSGVDETFIGILRFADDVISLFDCSFRLPRYTYLEIRGEAGALALPEPFRIENGSQVWLKQGEREEILTFPARNRYIDEIEAVAEFVFNGKPPAISLEDSRRNILSLQALLQSANEGHPVRLE